MPDGGWRPPSRSKATSTVIFPIYFKTGPAPLHDFRLPMRLSRTGTAHRAEVEKDSVATFGWMPSWLACGENCDLGQLVRGRVDRVSRSHYRLTGSCGRCWVRRSTRRGGGSSHHEPAPPTPTWSTSIARWTTACCSTPWRSAIATVGAVGGAGRSDRVTQSSGGPHLAGEQPLAVRTNVARSAATHGYVPGDQGARGELLCSMASFGAVTAGSLPGRRSV
jgi:hypothetical protein